MDCRDLLRDLDGWPLIPERDRLPLLRLIEGAALTAGFVRDSQMRTDAPHRLLRLSEIANQRDGVLHELPRSWLSAPVRANRLDSRRIKPFWRYQGAVKS